jgi:hypothetical protein
MPKSGNTRVTGFSGSPEVYTYRWALAQALPSFYVPVRISIGSPRYWPGARDLDAIHELMPYDILGRVHDRAGFERAYRARLDSFGADRIQRRFEKLFAQHGERPLVLLCYEDIVGTYDFCHRRFFAAWWQDQTGAAIHDLQHVDHHAVEPSPPELEPVQGVLL